VQLEQRLGQTSLPIVETFHSVQGEGYWTGCNAFFIRLAGCDVGCPWCDTKISWSTKHHPQRPLSDLVAEADTAHPQFVVITGGEPLMHNLQPLTQMLHQAGLQVHLETSGAHPLGGEWDWITLSPKPFQPPLAAIYPQVDELKVVIAQPQDLVWAQQQSERGNPEVVRYLQPEWGSAQAQQWVFDYVLHHPQWRISLQTHKFLGIR
jgi:organic radical activating enzyme